MPGGAEQVALHVAETHPELELVTAWVERAAFEPGMLPEARTRILTRPARIQGWHALKALRAFERPRPFWESYETVVFSGVYAPAAARHCPQARRLYYCHTPPRFVYDLEEHYRRSVAAPLRPVLAALARRVRRAYSQGLEHMDRIAANSANVQRRLQRHLGLEEVRIIHPPVATEQFRWLGQDDFYLSTARLEPYKRVELAVRAFMQLPDRRLLVASGGSELAKLERLAAGHDNIRFTGWLSAERLRELVGRCTATIYLPMDEDFGISPVESMAAGKPVIGAAEGGLLETVEHGESGWLIGAEELAGGDHRAVQALTSAIRDLDSSRARDMRAACEARAGLFGKEIFDRRFTEFLAG